MKKLKMSLTICLISSCLFWGCKHGKNNNFDDLPLKAWITLPSDSLTEYQRDLRVKIADIQAYDVKVVDNKLILDLSREEFESKGVPVKYYDEVIEALNKTNRDFDSMKIDNVKEIYEESMRDYKKNKHTWFE